MILSSITSGKSFQIEGKNIKVSISQSLVNKDLSGQTSATDVATAGNKPKKVKVSLLIPKDQPRSLSRLILLAEEIDANGDRIEYNIVDDTCRAVNVRRVRFSGSLSVREEDTLQAWSVSFSLQEVYSVAERKEKRLKKNEITATAADGQIISAAQNSFLAEKIEEFFKKNFKQ